MFLKFKNFEAGVTLIEIILVLLIIVLFSSIVIVNFPQMQARNNLTRSAYKMAQDLRKTLDLSLSGATLKDGTAEIKISGYGVFFDADSAKNEQYLVYADNCPVTAGLDQKYRSSYAIDVGGAGCLSGDRVLETNRFEKGVYIQSFTTIPGNSVSVDFTPPNPTTKISDSGDMTYGSFEIVLSLKQYPTITKKVLVNKFGLVEVE